MARKPRKTPDKTSKTPNFEVKKPKKAIDSLQGKKRLFVEFYLESFNATTAYISAGYSPKSISTAAVNASKLLRNAKVAQAISEELELRGVTRFRALLRLGEIVFGLDPADFEDYLEGKCSLKDLRDRGVNTKLIQAFQQESALNEDGVTVLKRKLTFLNVDSALRIVAKNLGLDRLVVDHNHSGKLSVEKLMDVKNMGDEELLRLAGITGVSGTLVTEGADE